MAGLENMVIGRQRQPLPLRAAMLKNAADLRDHVFKLALQGLDIGDLEIEGAELALILEEHVAIGGTVIVEAQIIDIIDALHIHGQTLEAIGQFARDRIDIHASDLLEIGVLADLHPVAPDLPAQAPGPDGGVFPVILDKAHVVQRGV